MRRSMWVVFAVIAIIMIANISHAQYTEMWCTGEDEGDHFIGIENMDEDAAKEVVLLQDWSSSDEILIYDAITGELEWELDSWYQISYSYEALDRCPRLVDVDEDGKYELLFKGRQTASDPSVWHLYQYTGSRIYEGEMTSSYREISLEQNYPNPANSATSITYTLPEDGNATIRIYNITGQIIRTLIDEGRVAGEYTIVWDGRNNTGKTVPSGTYFYQLETKNSKTSKKMIILK